jgi:hypothetical protein
LWEEESNIFARDNHDQWLWSDKFFCTLFPNNKWSHHVLDSSFSSQLPQWVSTILTCTCWAQRFLKTAVPGNSTRSIPWPCTNSPS